MKIARFLLAAALLTAIPAAAPLLAQDPAANQAPIRLQRVMDNVYWSSEGGNVAVVIGRDGVILFDAKVSPARAVELQARIAEITDKPIRAIILSHSDGDHINGIGGFPSDIPIIAHPQTAAEMREMVRLGQRGIPADQLPDRTVTGDVTLTIAGERVRLLNWGRAHTAGDLVAYLPRFDVVVASDIFCMDQPRPYIKPELNGDSAGWVRTARAIMALRPSWVIVGHGEPQTPANLAAFINDGDNARREIVRLARTGMSLPEVERAVAEPQPSTVPVPPGRHYAQFTRAVYGEVAGSR